jgi:hypothetical protein
MLKGQKVLALDDPKWNDLQSNYGTGSSVARLISRAVAGEALDDWYDDLFQELLHQYTLSQSAYAALPHLVEIARQRPETRMHLLVLIGACCAHSGDPGLPALPAEFKEEWHSAIKEALTLITALLAEGQFTENEMRYLLASLAALHGHLQLSQIIEALDVEIECSQCGALIDLMLYHAGKS